MPSEHEVFVESDSTVGTVTGTGSSGDPFVGDGDLVLQHAIDDLKTGYGVGWAVGDVVKVTCGNKEKYDITALLNLGTLWTGDDDNNKGIIWNSRETRDKADGGTFITRPDGREYACWELDGLGTEQKPFSFTSLATQVLNCKSHDFTQYGIDGSMLSVVGCEIYNIDGTAFIDGGIYNIEDNWLHDPVDSLVKGIEAASGNVLNNLIQGAYTYSMGASSSAHVAFNTVEVEGSGAHGIYTTSHDRSLIDHNTILSLDGADDQNAVYIVGTGAHNNLVTNNAIQGFNGTGATWFRSESLNVMQLRGNKFKSCNAAEFTASAVIAALDLNNEEVTELFFNASNGDYRIHPSSPALGSGRPTDMVKGGHNFNAGANQVDMRELGERFAAGGFARPWVEGNSGIFTTE